MEYKFDEFYQKILNYKSLILQENRGAPRFNLTTDFNEQDLKNKLEEKSNCIKRLYAFE